MPNPPFSLEHPERAPVSLLFHRFRNQIGISAVELSDSEVKGGKKPRMISKKLMGTCLSGHLSRSVCFFACLFKSSPKDMLIDFRERKGERETENHGCERETAIGSLLSTPRRGIDPANLLV